jgi:hypothetical protein
MSRNFGGPVRVICNQGTEYGALKWKDRAQKLKLGDRVEIYCSNLDMSTNASMDTTSHGVIRLWTCGQSWVARASRNDKGPLDETSTD